MTAKVVKLAEPAEPTIARVLDEFLAEPRARLRPQALRRYADVIHLLRGHRHRSQEGAKDWVEVSDLKSVFVPDSKSRRSKKAIALSREPG
jgi:hypothetical protein